MKRYFIVEEYFGIRIYDSKLKKEYYFDKKLEEKIKTLLTGEYTLINHKKNNAFCSPIKISMNLTKKCNLRCVQCFSDSGISTEEELSTLDMYKLFDEMASNGTFYICLGGGEPFTREDLFDILEYGKQKQLAISVITNGLLLTKEKLLKLNNLDLDYLWISFEGLEENHDKLRVKGTFNKAIKKLELINRYYIGKTAIRMSINKFNIHECPDLLKIAEKYNINLIRFSPLLSFGRAKGKNITIDQAEYIKFLNLMSKLKSNTVDIIYPNMENDKIWIGSIGFGCHCGKEAIWIDELGNVSPCIFWGEEFNVGNIKNEKYDELWKKVLNIACIEGNSTCENCENYRKCRGGCRARALFENKNLNDVDPLCPLRKNKI